MIYIIKSDRKVLHLIWYDNLIIRLTMDQKAIKIRQTAAENARSVLAVLPSGLDHTCG